MKKTIYLGLCACVAVLAVASFLMAEAAGRLPAGDLDAVALRAPSDTDTFLTLDYFDPNGSTHYWDFIGGDPRYVGNIFRPESDWYPLSIQRLEVIFAAVDTSASGTVNRVAVFDGTGNLLAGVADVPGVPVGTWVPFTFSSAPEIAAGDFWGGAWQRAPGSPNRDNVRCGVATSAWTDSNEPQIGIRNPAATSAAPSGWYPTQIGTPILYPTVSAAAVRAVIDTSTVPVEIMRDGFESGDTGAWSQVVP
ncbi:MAG: hypothetical protein ABFS37_07540 [Acidobacteriota bacterium]